MLTSGFFTVDVVSFVDNEAHHVDVSIFGGATQSHLSELINAKGIVSLRIYIECNGDTSQPWFSLASEHTDLARFLPLWPDRHSLPPAPARRLQQSSSKFQQITPQIRYALTRHMEQLTISLL